MKIRILFLVIAGLRFGSALYAQVTEDFNPPRANCCLANTAKSLADQLQDWNQLGRYHQANQQLKKQPIDPKRVVFMGDSITDLWRLEEYMFRFYDNWVPGGVLRVYSKRHNVWHFGIAGSMNGW